MLILLGFLFGIGSLYNIFGWADISTLSAYCICATGLLRRTQDKRVYSKRAVVIAAFATMIAALVIGKGIFSVPAFPEYPEGLTNQEWIFAGGLYSLALSIGVLQNTEERSKSLLGISIGLGAYGILTFILSIIDPGVSNWRITSAYDIHVGSGLGVGVNTTPPSLAIVTCQIGLLGYLGRTSGRIKSIAYVVMSVVCIAALFLWDRRIPLVFSTASFAYYLWVMRPTRMSTSRTILSSALLGLGVVLLIANSRIGDTLGKLIVNPRSADPDRYDRYSLGLVYLWRSIAREENLMKVVPGELGRENILWHNAVLDAFQIGGIMLMICAAGWILLNLWLAFLKPSKCILPCILAVSILLTEPTIHKKYYDFICPFTLTLIGLNSAMLKEENKLDGRYIGLDS